MLVLNGNSPVTGKSVILVEYWHLKVVYKKVTVKVVT